MNVRRVPKNKKRKERDETRSFKEATHEAKESYTLGLAAEQNNEISRAYHHYTRVTKLLQAYPFDKEWRRSEFRLAMQAIERRASLIEESKIEDDLQILAAEACRIYHVSPGIECVDFRLTAIRMLLARYDIVWNDAVLTNDVAPHFTAEKLDIIEEGFLNISGSIQQDIQQNFTEKNARLATLARSFIMLGSAYIRIALFNKAITSYLYGMQELAKMTIKDGNYTESLYVIFHTLNLHINKNSDYPLLRFARGLLVSGSNHNPTFGELAALFLQVENQHHNVDQVKLSLWLAFTNVLLQRVGEGRFALGKDKEYLSDFPDCDFWEALADPAYQHQLSTMRGILVSRASAEQLMVKPPELDMRVMLRSVSEMPGQAVISAMEFSHDDGLEPLFPGLDLAPNFGLNGNSFTFFGSQSPSSPLREQQQDDNWLDLDMTPNKETSFGF